MTNVFGVVAEFNPFHNGHQVLLQAAREQGAHAVVAVMSGNFVQRGAPAITDKRVRVHAALLCGADLVLELPLSCCVAPAQRFARGAVELLAATGCVDTLLFGSECGDAAALHQLAGVVESPVLQPEIRAQLAQGITYARARQCAIAKQCGEATAELLAGSNNTLAVEYLRAAANLGWKPKVRTIQRVGVEHDSVGVHNGFASASLLRARANDVAFVRAHVPAAAAKCYEQAMKAGLYPADGTQVETAVLSCLRRLGPNDFAQLPDLSEGLENRFYAAVRRAGSLADLEMALKTKRYTMARVRRLILTAYLGLTEEDAHTSPPYLRVLGCNARGRELLSEMKKRASLPVSHSLARLREQGDACEHFAYLEERATDLYALTLPKPPACGYEYFAPAVFLD